MELATRRAIGFLIDTGLCWLAFYLLSLAGLTFVLVNAALFLAYRGGVSAASGGVTVGRLATGTALKDGCSNDNVSLLRSVLREIPLAACLGGFVLVGALPGLLLLFLVAPALMLVDWIAAVSSSGSIGWRDHLVRTRVVRTSPGWSAG